MLRNLSVSLGLQAIDQYAASYPAGAGTDPIVPERAIEDPAQGILLVFENFARSETPQLLRFVNPRRYARMGERPCLHSFPSTHHRPDRLAARMHWHRPHASLAG